MRNVEISQALLYSTMGSVMFNFGSILIWSLSRVYLPENTTFLIFYGYLSSFTLISIARSYIHILDKTDF